MVCDRRAPVASECLRRQPHARRCLPALVLRPVDELNRAFAKAPWSGYVPKVHLVTAENVAKDGGPKNLFDPDNGYRKHYTAIWGK